MDPKKLLNMPRILTNFPGIEVGEHFKIKDWAGNFWFDKDGALRFDSDSVISYLFAILTSIINHPENIIRRPQFSDDEKAMMRLLINAGFPWIIRADRWLYACQNEPSISLPGFKANGESEPLPPELLSQIQDLTPFDAAAYLESEESK